MIGVSTPAEGWVKVGGCGSGEPGQPDPESFASRQSIKLVFIFSRLENQHKLSAVGHVRKHAHAHTLLRRDSIGKVGQVRVNFTRKHLLPRSQRLRRATAHEVIIRGNVQNRPAEKLLSAGW